LRVDRLVGGRYRLEERLGEGTGGVVWRARHVGLGRTFAVKLLQAGVIQDPEARARFAREAEALGRIRHPNVVAVTDFGIDEADGTPYLVMEPAAGVTLAEHLRAGRLSLDQRLQVLQAVAAGVDAAHAAGVLHRDLKPANVMVSDAGVRVLDFGLARFAAAPPEPPGGDRLPDDGGLTDAHMLVGTPAYLAPEVARDARAASAASDVYAFAVMTYEALAGHPPFAGPTREVLRAHQDEPPPPLPLADGVWEALRAGLAKEAALRPPRAGALIAAVAEALRRARAAERDRGRFRRAAWASAGLAVVATLLGLGLRRPLALADGRLGDLAFRLSAPVPPDERVLLLTLDDAGGPPGVASLAEAGDVVAPVLERALDAGARAVAIDLLLPRAWSRSQRFSELLVRHADRIVLAAYSSASQGLVGTDCVAGLTAVALGPERTAALFGFVNLDEDADGVTRRARRAFHDVAGRPRPSWPAAAARHLRPEGAPLEAAPFRIDHRLRLETLSRLAWPEATRLLDERPEVFRDRLVLVGIGPTASGDDVHRVPASAWPGGRAAGLLLQASIVTTILRGRPVREAPPEPFAAGALIAVGALAAGVLCYARTLWTLGLAALIVAAYAWGAVAALGRAGMMWPLAWPLATLALGLLLTVAARRWLR